MGYVYPTRGHTVGILLFCLMRLECDNITQTEPLEYKSWLLSHGAPTPKTDARIYQLFRELAECSYLESTGKSYSLAPDGKTRIGGLLGIGKLNTAEFNLTVCEVLKLRGSLEI